MTTLNPQELQTELRTIGGWELDGLYIRREFQFKTFVQAFGWMTSVALVAESMDHHPEWKNVYNRVSVALSTHDAGKVTSKDLALAKKMNELYGL